MAHTHSVALSTTGHGRAFTCVTYVLTPHRPLAGRPVNVTEAMISEIPLEPEQMWISWRGRQLLDNESLEAIGLRTDDEVMLEFISPVTPPVLVLLRKPEAPKPAKGKKGKGGKGKKKK